MLSEDFLINPLSQWKTRLYSFSELDQLSDRFASYLQTVKGLEKGDRILVQLPNCLSFPVVVFGALKFGLILVPCNLYTQHELTRIVEDAEPKIAVCLGFKKDLFATSHIPNIVYSDIYDIGPIKDFLKIRAYSPLATRGTWLKQESRSLQTFRSSSQKPIYYNSHADDPAVLQYTGGSPGVKGAVLTHRNITSNVSQLRQFWVIISVPARKLLSPYYRCTTFSLSLFIA